ncbi:hypothetical protein [Gilvimarinus xylanilyticus]|uniref:Fimbrial biogenesis outer membrane usher protein n=1 Tax=Gilvimarinus xylanilyticus TaxID=2944139 RepID=A0A9X2I1L4_9GAMM|nr:hypothetical protein [Gilvimarinus xylanilyticus]MCP8898670.1 hypothetical protein [Gilvimarinus xylanilyticus]
MLLLTLFSLKTQADPQTSAGTSEPVFLLTGPLSLDERYLGDIDLKVTASGRGQLDSHRLLQLLEPLISSKLYNAYSALAEKEKFRSFSELSINGVHVAYDPASLGAQVTLPVTLRGSNTLRLSGLKTPNPWSANQPAKLVGGVRLSGQSTWLYGNQRTHQVDTARADAFVTLGGFSGVTFDGSVNYNSSAPESTEFEGWKLTKDFFITALRLQAGEIPTLGSGLQGSTEIKGVGIFRQYQAIRPFQNVRPTGRQSLLLEQPSTVEIYVNGDLIQTLNLPPGPYNLDEFPLVDGFNNVQFRVLDPAGNEEIIDKSVLYSPAILGSGITDFGVWIGEPMLSNGLENDLASTAYWLRGIGAATVGVNMQASNTGHQLGGTTVLANENGFISIDLAWGQHRETRRNGLSAAVNGHLILSLRQPDDLRLNLRAEHFDRYTFDPLRSSPLSRRRWESAFNGSWKLGETTSLSFGAAAQQRYNQESTQWSANIGITRRIGELSFNIYTNHVKRADGSGETSFRLSLTMPLGYNARTASRYDSRNDRTELELSRYRRQQISDWSARARVGSETLQSDTDLEAAWYGQRLYTRANHSSVNPSGSTDHSVNRTSLQASTTVGFAGDQFGWGQSSPSGFTVVNVHRSLKNSDSQFVQAGEIMFREDGLGPALVPAPIGYTPSDQEVVIEDLPVGYALTDTLRTIMPGYFSGYQFSIGSAAHRSVIGILLTPDKEPAALLLGYLIPQEFESPKVEFFSSVNGQFFAQGLGSGRYAIEIDGKVRGTINVPDDEDILTDFGEVLLNE